MIGRTTESAFQDARAVSLTQGELEKNNRIKTYFQKDDKIPNIDGYFETLGSAGLPLKRFAVQIKGKDKLEYRKTLKKYSYSADSGFFQYMLEGIESNPGMFFVAERNTGRVFFKYVSGEFLEELVRKGLLSRGSFTIRFDEEDILDEKRFYSLCEEIRNGGKLPFDPDSIIPADIDFKSIRKLSEGLWVNWKTGRLDCDVTAALLEERRDRNVTAALPEERRVTDATAALPEERRDCGKFLYREQAGKLPALLSKASLRLLSVLVQGEGAVVCWEELYRRGIVMHETIGKTRRASDQVLREGSGEAYAEPDREDFAEMAAAGGSAHPTGVEMAAGGSAYPIGGEMATGGSAYPIGGETAAGGAYVTGREMATGSAHPTGEEPEAVGGAYPKDGEIENAGSVYPSDEEAEHILEGALKTVDGEEAGDSLKQKVTAVIAAIRELCAQAPGLTKIVRPAKNGKGFRIILKETGIRSMRGYFPEADGTDAANAEWDTLTKNIENGYCDTKGWLRRHYAAVCASFEGKISNAGGNIKKESKVFGNYTMAEAYSHAYAQSARADTAEPMLDFVEQWYREIRAQMSAQRMAYSDENALNRVLVLHGNPGDGKTTFCKKAVYAHCLEGWLADVPHVVRVSLNRNENRGILKEKSLNLANALGIFMRPTNQFLFCAPHKLGEGSVVILDGYDELVGDLAGDVNVSTFAEFCDRVREQADICKWFVIITSRTMCIRRELDEKKDDFETGTVASFAPMTVARQDLMIDRMIELDEARRQNSGPGRTPGGSNDVTDLRTYQEGELKKLRNEKRIRKFLEIPILFRMIVTTRFKAGEGDCDGGRALRQTFP
ncbi:MAG: hypothetical protein Q4A32_06675 [Lachnospiraceae bacterium]|nr:hypothetical protein [Lachnospiraceae bacterium]